MVLGLSPSSLLCQAKPTNDYELRLAMIRLAKQFVRYGCRKLAALLRIEGWRVNHSKIELVWSEEGLQLFH
jgi:putative transposase